MSEALVSFTQVPGWCAQPVSQLCQHQIMPANTHSSRAEHSNAARESPVSSIWTCGGCRAALCGEAELAAQACSAPRCRAEQLLTTAAGRLMKLLSVVKGTSGLQTAHRDFCTYTLKLKPLQRACHFCQPPSPMQRVAVQGQNARAQRRIQAPTVTTAALHATVFFLCKK